MNKCNLLLLILIDLTNKLEKYICRSYGSLQINTNIMITEEQNDFNLIRFFNFLGPMFVDIQNFTGTVHAW